jgi:group I intron endonuclease
MIGIYAIINKINSKIYIGKSININKRWKKEINGATNKHLQNAFKKYGIDNFEFIYLCLCNEDELNEKEIYWINKCETTNPKYGYNKTFGGDGGKPSDEIRKKISESLKGEKNPMYGLRGKKQSDESNEKNRQYHLGKKVSNKTKEKISESLKGKEAHNKGKKTSNETKKKTSDSLKLYWLKKQNIIQC